MKKLIVTLTIIGLMSACGGKTEQNSSTSTPKAEQKKAPVEAYLSLKDALVATNSEEAAEAAKAFMAVTKDERLVSPLKQIAATSEVEDQRKAFETLSMAMYEIVKAGNSETVLYKQYCPMAFNNKGAYWLAAESEVNNPYFGDVMLHCGRVEETINQ
ncbi:MULTISPECIES: DUF3347 domain-containing protein [Roseivirga]|jgi:hypothetical protein|uniref:DUF3347 domain-containing protein n=1 Tax=Roseivirga thermotolerans TaxID=1758176 RepID=A0ABQ3I9C0_9BACT|nr:MULTISPECIES: DUF3347 domain-containing protein [Roseivirga]MEC7754940.1 DUF3347 domain-containing protein [Bacteroidota bacterium]GHE75328.1 hypothetical protein GCM10011340_35230 [Roseivirga thermotolerans]|tara:strand:- start:6473 stop:6946 length:474 start_codon:yes stop_codon:yes gene_type:complete